MNLAGKTLTIETSPHLASGASVDAIMRNVVVALVPTTLFAIYVFGIAALLAVATAVVTAVLTEHALCRVTARATTVRDGSVVITGLLFGLTLPPGLPLWMVALGASFGVGVGKFLFGGLGYNAFNPALVGRAFLQAAFPAAMTTWHAPLMPDRFTTLPASSFTFPLARPDYDAMTAATPLARMKFEQTPTDAADLLLGVTGGSIGETGVVLILMGGLWLVARRMMDWRIPCAIFVTVGALSALFNWLEPSRYAGPAFMLCSGGLMLGAVFMATDMVASPNTAPGVALYGVLIGGLVVTIRYWGGMPEGVMYAILIANAVSPHIDKWFRPRVFGAVRRKRGNAWS